METNLFQVSNYTFTLYALAPLVVGVLTAGLGIAVLIRERFSLVSVMFCLMTSLGAAWLLGYVGIYSAHNETLATAWAKIENGAVVLIPSAVAFFTLAVTDRYRRFQPLAWLSLLISGLFLLGLLLTDGFVSGVYRYSWGYFAHYGPLSIPFILFFFGLMLFCLRLYQLEYRRASTETRKRRFKSLFIAFSMAYLGSVDYLPAFGISVYPIGYLPVFLFLGMAAHTIWKYQLVEITPAFAADQILRTMSDALLVLDREGVVRTANHAACRLFGRPETELVGNPIWSINKDFFPIQQLERFLRTRTIHGYETLYPNPEESKIALDVSISAIRDGNGRPVGVICIARDITERKQAENQLREAHGKLKKSLEELKATQLQLIQAAKMESVGRLAAGVAHEVKNPLAVILQGLSYLSKPLANSEDGNIPIAINYAKDAVRRADVVIRGLLDFSALKELEIRPGELHPVIEQALLLVKHELDKHHIRLVRKFDPNLPLVPLDKNKMEQVFVNLLVNAIQAMPGGGTLTLRTSVKQLAQNSGIKGTGRENGPETAESAAAVEIEDTGVGIPQEILPKIFDPFFTTKPTGKGTGLGLSVTKNIIQLHGGMIDIRNREGGGVKVTLFLKTDEGQRHEQQKTNLGD
ncbi:MAG: PAS domain S-box protein [Candidatus Omnitrophica bacterium]|nr:PAS domain S-box protein [Candidatus Omnitrophota bacterium]